MEQSDPRIQLVAGLPVPAPLNKAYTISLINGSVLRADVVRYIDRSRYWITEEQVDGVAAAMARRGFVARNYSYLVIDEGWFTFSNNTDTTRFDTSGADVDAFGRWLPSLDRFPSAAAGAGFRSLCDRLFAQHGVL